MGGCLTTNIKTAVSLSRPSSIFVATQLKVTVHPNPPNPQSHSEESRSLFAYLNSANMSFRRQLKATFKEMFGSSTGGKEPLDESSSKKAARNKTEKISKKGGAKTVSANESSVVAQLVQGPGAVIVAIATTASGASGGDNSSQDGQFRKVGNGAEASSSRKADHYADVKKNPPGVVLPLGVPCSEPEA